MLDIKIVGNDSLTPQEEEALRAFGIRSAYKKSRDRVFHLPDASSVILAQEVAKEAESKCRFMVLNYRFAMKTSSVHHIYGKRIPGLTIKDPIALTAVKNTALIGDFWGIPIWMIPLPAMNGFPPIIINSKRKCPIKIVWKKDLSSSMNPRNILVSPVTYFANCGEVIEAELRSSMGAYDNLERYKRFMKTLSEQIIQSEGSENE